MFLCGQGHHGIEIKLGDGRQIDDVFPLRIGTRPGNDGRPRKGLYRCAGSVPSATLRQVGPSGSARSIVMASTAYASTSAFETAASIVDRQAVPSATNPRRSSRIHTAATGMPKGEGKQQHLERSGSGSPDPRVGGAQATAPSRKARSPAVTGPRTTTALWHRVREVPAELTSRPRRVSVPRRFRRTATTRSVVRRDGRRCSTRDRSGLQAHRWALFRPSCDRVPSECSDQR